MSFTSKHKGIYYDKSRKKWSARIMIDNKNHFLGRFNTEEEAIKIYEEKIKNLIPENDSRKRSTNKKRPIFKRDSDGLIDRVCIDCGKIDKFNKAPQNDRCRSCGKKEFYKYNPANGLKTIDNIDEVIKEYKNGKSLEEIAQKYNTTAMTIRSKILKAGHKTRDYKEATILSNDKYSNLKKAHNKIKTMCKTGEFQRNKSAKLQGISPEEWTGFITPENERLYKSPEWKELQKQCFKKDNYICQLCKIRGGHLQMHHIKPKAKYPELQLCINNVVTLCKKCHDSTKGNEEKYEHHFT